MDIVNEADLETVIGKTPPSMHLKVIDHLDDGALRWIKASPLLFAAISDMDAVDVTIGGDKAGFAQGAANELQLPLRCFDDIEPLRAGRAWGSLFLLPHIRETLRVNGTITQVTEDMVRIAVSECYGHCGKALIRSDFWSALPDANGDIGDSSFMALATADYHGHADLSPRGDPAGKLAVLDGDTFLFSDRPGNRRTDSLRNMLARPQLAALLIQPGSTWTTHVSGQVLLTADEARRSIFTVRDKVPHLVVAVRQVGIVRRDSPALQRAQPWSGSHPDHGIDAPGLFMNHIHINKDKGLAARTISLISAVPGAPRLLKKGLEKDYKDNLY